jgi:hypothetical protein
MTQSTEIQPCNVDDFQTIAKSKLPKALYEYLASGTDDEQTLSREPIRLQNVVSSTSN